MTGHNTRPLAYRRVLRRTLPPTLDAEWGGRVLFVMLNPSTADEHTDDPTIRRCLGFARRFGCSEMRVVNLYELRATSPRDLARVQEPDRFEDDEETADGIIHLEASTVDLVIAAWGASLPHPEGLTRALHVRSLLRAATIGSGGSLRCLGMTSEFHPRHPLYLPADAPLLPYELERDLVAARPDREADHG